MGKLIIPIDMEMSRRKSATSKFCLDSHSEHQELFKMPIPYSCVIRRLRLYFHRKETGVLNKGPPPMIENEVLLLTTFTGASVGDAVKQL